MAEAATVSAPTSSRHWTVADYLSMTEEYPRYELYRGELIQMTSPNSSHQRLLLDLAIMFREVVRKGDLGEVFVAPLDVIFDDENTAQPDIIFVSKENRGIVRERIFGAPDLVVEILSSSTLRRDRYEKLELYAQQGVREYWIVDEANQAVEILGLREGRFVLLGSAVRKGRVNSGLLADLAVEVSSLFVIES